MQEIEVKENSLNVKVFINGIPDLKNIPKEKAESILAALESKEKAESILAALESEISQFFENSKI